jgi:transcriptional regulator with XRE-family HTH domain
MSKKVTQKDPLTHVDENMLIYRPNFAKNLASIRKQFELSYNELGSAIDGTGAALSDIEKDRTTTTMNRFEKLCKYFSIEPQEFVKKKMKLPKPGTKLPKPKAGKTVFNNILCHNLSTAIDAHEVSFITIAEYAGVSPSTIWRIQTNQDVNVSLPIVERLSICLGIPFQELLTRKFTKKDFK